MSDEITAPENTDTADGANAPDESTIDYAKRYNDLRPEFDRTKQQLSELEAFKASLSDPQTRADALSAIGLQFEEEEEDDDTPDFDDPIESLAQRVNRIEAERQAADDAAAEEARQEQTADYILSEIDKIEKSIGRGLTKTETKLVSLAAQAEPDERGVPNVAAAWAELQAEHEARQQEYFKTKRAPRAPGGQSASKQPDLSKADERADFIDAALSAASD